MVNISGLRRLRKIQHGFPNMLQSNSQVSQPSDLTQNIPSWFTWKPGVLFVWAEDPRHIRLLLNVQLNYDYYHLEPQFNQCSVTITYYSFLYKKVRTVEVTKAGFYEKYMTIQSRQ